MKITDQYKAFAEHERQFAHGEFHTIQIARDHLKKPCVPRSTAGMSVSVLDKCEADAIRVFNLADQIEDQADAFERTYAENQSDILKLESITEFLLEASEEILQCRHRLTAAAKSLNATIGIASRWNN